MHKMMPRVLMNNTMKLTLKMLSTLAKTCAARKAHVSLGVVVPKREMGSYGIMVVTWSRWGWLALLISKVWVALCSLWEAPQTVARALGAQNRG